MPPHLSTMFYLAAFGVVVFVVLCAVYLALFRASQDDFQPGLPQPYESIHARPAPVLRYDAHPRSRPHPHKPTCPRPPLLRRCDEGRPLSHPPQARSHDKSSSPPLIHRRDEHLHPQSYGGTSCQSRSPQQVQRSPNFSTARSGTISQTPIARRDDYLPSPSPQLVGDTTSRPHLKRVEYQPTLPPQSTGKIPSLTTGRDQYQPGRSAQPCGGASSQSLIPQYVEDSQRQPSQPIVRLSSQPRIPSHRYVEHLPSDPSRSIPFQPPVSRHERQQVRQTVGTASRKLVLEVGTHVSLRTEAKQEGDLMSLCYRRSQEAYRRHDRALAKTLSEQGKRHELKMNHLNKQASDFVFKENNKNKNACTVDLHGLYVKEAIAFSERAIAEARKRGDSEVRLIVGQGNHSDGGVARLKPAIQNDLQARGCHVKVDPKNSGALVVRLDDI